MSDGSQKLFDRILLRQRRERISATLADYDFLLQRAAIEMDERLDLVLRDFSMALDLGAGNGAMALKLLARTDVGHVLAGDHSLDLMRNLKGVERLICDEEKLPFGEASLNLVTSILSLHFVNDLPGALIQISRALKPDGLFMAAIPGGQTLIELRTAFMLAEEEIMAGVSPRVAPMADVKDYGGLLQRAGFALPVVDSDLVTVTYDSPLKLMHELRMMGAGNILCDRLKKPLSRSLLQRVVEIYERDYSTDKRINASFEIIYLSGWSPHESQRQPLAPGLGKTSLAGVFGACTLPDRGDEIDEK
ncbi:MAG: methyltransferase domain-containing protein [bacterium]|nr:methyltransferase domain-containing protein [bacterium]